jgi:hypothetical protein
MAERTQRDEQRLAIKLGAAQRRLVLVVALALIGAGGTAVFVAHNDAGAASLVISGVALLLFAVAAHFLPA